MKDLSKYINESGYSDYVDSWHNKRISEEPLYAFSQTLKDAVNGKIRTLYDHSMMINNYDIISLVPVVNTVFEFSEDVKDKSSSDFTMLFANIESIEHSTSEYKLRIENSDYQCSLYENSAFMNEENLKRYILNTITNDLSDKLPSIIKKFEDDIICIVYTREGRPTEMLGMHILVQEGTEVSQQVQSEIIKFMKNLV